MDTSCLNHITLFKAAVDIRPQPNHPGGDPSPSSEDRRLTERSVESGKRLGIPVRDHVIVGDGTNKHYSFADAGGFG